MWDWPRAWDKGTSFKERSRPCSSTGSENKCRHKDYIHFLCPGDSYFRRSCGVDGSLEVCVDSLHSMANPFSFHMACLISSERDRTLQVELERAQVLRGRLEEVLGRSLERLSRLETLAASGGGELESVQVRHKHAFWALAGQTATRMESLVCTNQREPCLTLAELNGDLLMIKLVQVASSTKWNSL